MTSTHRALQLLAEQERLELLDWYFSPRRPVTGSPEWCIIANNPRLGLRGNFWSIERNDALAQALQFASNEQAIADTVTAEAAQ